MLVGVVVAMTPSGGIGAGGALPWPRLAGDMRHFQAVTTMTRFPGMQNAVIMGRGTWDSIPAARRPLAGRLNIVLSRDAGWLPDGAHIASSLDDALRHVAPICEAAFVIGGAGPIAEALSHPSVTHVYATHVEQEFPHDVTIPVPDPAAFQLVSKQASVEDAGVPYHFALYRRKDGGANPEAQYLSLVR